MSTWGRRWLWAMTCCFAISALACLVLSSALHLSARHKDQEQRYERAKRVAEILASRQYTRAQKGILLRPYIRRGMSRGELLCLLGEPDYASLGTGGLTIEYRYWELIIVLRHDRVVRVVTLKDPMGRGEQ